MHLMQLSVEDVPSVWVPATHVGVPRGVPHSGLWIGPDQAIETIWGVKQLMKDSSLYVSLSFCFSKQSMFHSTDFPQ